MAHQERQKHMRPSFGKRADPGLVTGADASIGRLLRMVTSRLSTAMRSRLVGTGVSAGELEILRILSERRVCRPSDIADAVGASLPTVSKITYKLLERALIVQSSAAQDHRCKYLHLTASGRQIVEELAMSADSAGEYVFRKLNPDERRQLTKLLLKLVQI